MMTEISLNILDIAQNSVKAQATLIQISVIIDTKSDKMIVIIDDNGCGMTKEQLENVEDPFYTTRTTRKVGLGVPFFKYAALSTGGDFSIQSETLAGTSVKAVFGYSHIDRMPLGDINSTIHTLIHFNSNIDFLYMYRYDDQEFVLDTRVIREMLSGVPIDTPEVSDYIRDYLKENKEEVDKNQVI